MKYYTVLLLLLITSASFSQKNNALIQRIDSMFKEDQRWRIADLKLQQHQQTDYNEVTIQQKMGEADSINKLKAKAIIKEFGFPGYNKVGDWSNDFWAIVQHCDDDIAFQKQVLVLLKKEVDRNNASKENYALLTDRILVGENKKQIYGTQIQRDLTTGKSAPFPLKYPKQVDRLRRKMGLEPLAVYVKQFNR